MLLEKCPTLSTNCWRIQFSPSDPWSGDGKHFSGEQKRHFSLSKISEEFPNLANTTFSNYHLNLFQEEHCLQELVVHKATWVAATFYELGRIRSGLRICTDQFTIVRDKVLRDLKKSSKCLPTSPQLQKKKDNVCVCVCVCVCVRLPFQAISKHLFLADYRWILPKSNNPDPTYRWTWQTRISHWFKKSTAATCGLVAERI